MYVLGEFPSLKIFQLYSKQKQKEPNPRLLNVVLVFPNPSHVDYATPTLLIITVECVIHHSSTQKGTK